MMDADQQLGTLAAAVASGQAVDWDAAESAASDDSTRRAIRELRVIAGILQLHASDDQLGRAESPADAGATLTPEPNLRSIGRWGPLLLLSPLGKGAYGDVYRAWDPRVHRQVAFKLVRATEPEDRRLFEVIEEARLLAKVRHPNVVTLYGAERIEGQVGLWMEFIEGQSLEQVLASQGPLSAQEAGTIAIAVCRALAAVHRAGIVHRDVKAHNVMREFGGRIVLMDFGTGLDLESDSTRPGGISGTPLYLAPEILNGDRPDAAGDIYSTGVLLYHLVTNRYPVTGASLESLRQAHRQGGRAFLSDVRPDLPVAFVRVVEQALAPDARSRFTSAGAFEAALAHAISAAEASVGIESRGSVPRIRRRRVSPAVLFAAVGSLTAAAAISWLVVDWTPGERSQHGQQAAAATPGSLRLRQLQTPTWMYTGRPSSDGRLLPFVDVEGNLGLFSLEDGTARMLTNKGDSAEHGESQIAISPDGSAVAYTWASLDGAFELRLIGSDGRRARVLLRQSEIEYPGPVQWLPDGSEILAVLEMKGGRRVLAIVDAQDGAVRDLRDVASLPTTASLSPDGRYVAFDEPEEHSDRRQIILLDVSTGAETGRLHDERSNGSPLWTSGGDLLFTSDRAGAPGLWLTSVHEGRPDPKPRLLYREFSRAVPLGISREGELLYMQQTGLVDVYVAPIDFANDNPVGEPEAITPAAVGSNDSSGWSPDGRRLAYITRRGGLNRVEPRLVIRDMTEGTERMLRLPLASCFMPRWSPDGRMILVNGVSLQGEAGAYLVDPELQDVRLALPTMAEGHIRIANVIWSPDGDSLWHDRVADGVYSRNLSTGTDEKLVDYRAEGLLQLAGRPESLRLSPDGRRLAFYGFPRDDPDAMVLRVKAVGEDRPSRELLRRRVPDRFSVQVWSADSQELLLAMFKMAQQARREQELFRLRLDDPVPRPTGFTMPGARYFDVSRDGRKVTFTSGSAVFQLWMMEGLLQP